MMKDHFTLLNQGFGFYIKMPAAIEGAYNSPSWFVNWIQPTLLTPF